MTDHDHHRPPADHLGDDGTSGTWHLSTPWRISAAALALIGLLFLMMLMAWAAAQIAASPNHPVPAPTALADVLYRHGLPGLIGRGSAGWFYCAYYLETAAMVVGTAVLARATAATGARR